MLTNDFIRQFPGMMCIKDLNSRHVHASNITAKLCGWKNVLQAEGRSDREIPCHANEHADIFIEQDQYVIQSGQQWIGFDIVQYCDGWHIIFSKKNPFRNKQNQISAVLHSGIDLSDPQWHALLNGLFNMDLKFYSNKKKMISYHLQMTKNSIFDQLSNREQECLFYLIRGKSIKMIASLLNLSIRTIETHINHIREKLNCKSKQILIEFALCNNYLQNIPKSVFQRHLSVQIDL